MAEPSAPLSSDQIAAIRVWAAWMPFEGAAPEPTEDQWATLREMDTRGGTLSSSLMLTLLSELDRLAATVREGEARIDHLKQCIRDASPVDSVGRSRLLLMLDEVQTIWEWMALDEEAARGG